METNRSGYHLHLFLLRLWREWLGQDLFEWRGEVKNISSGEIRYFRDGATLFDSLCVMADDRQATTEEDRDGSADDGCQAG